MNNEKKYLIGYLNGHPYVVFADISNYNCEVDDEGYIHITFTDKDGGFHYKGNQGKFVEVDGKAPTIDDYEVRGRRTVRSRGYLDKIGTETTPDEYRNKEQRRRDFEDNIRRVEDDPNFVPYTEPYDDGGWYYNGCGGSICGGGGWRRYGGCGGFSGC